MKYLHTLIVFLLTASLYAQTPTTVLEGITNLNAPTAIHGDDLYYVSDSDHVYKIDLTEANPTPQAVISALSQNYDSSYIYDLAFHEDTLYLSVPYVIDTHSLTDILKVDLTANTLTTERVTGFTVPISPIAILGDDLYIATNRLLKLNLTLENPMSEVVMTSLPEDNTNENFSDFIFDGNILYMASIGESNNKGVFKVDVAAENPAYEKIVESGDVAGIALNGNSLYYDRQGNKIQRIQDVNGGTLKGANLLTSGMNSVGQLAIHNNHLYIADPGVGKILKYPLSPFEAIYEFGQPMAVHGDDLYYASDEDHIYKIDLTAENPATEAVVSFPKDEPLNYSFTTLAFHGDMLYVSESDITNGDKISRVDLTADPPSIEELYQTDVFVDTPISFLGDYIYFVNLTDDDQHQLLRMDVTAQTPTAEVVLTLPSAVEVDDMAFHGNDLYLISANGSETVHRVDVTAETPVLEELSGFDSNHIVFEGNRLYYSTPNAIKVVQNVSSGSLKGVDVLTEGLGNPFGLVIHNNHLYIADRGTGEIVIHPLAGIAYEAIFELGQPVAVHGDDLYYVSDEDHIYKIDLTAENPATEAVVSFPREDPHNYSFTSLAFHGDMLYVNESDITNGDKISRVDLTTDPPTIEEVYLLGSTPTITPISFLGDYIYFVNFIDDDQYQLQRLDVTAQTPTAEVVLMLPSSAEDMAFHGNDLYLISADSSGGTDHRVDVTVETPVLEELPNNLDPVTRGILFQGNSLYYSTSNRIKVIPDVSSETFEGVDVITEGLSDPFGLVIHNNHLYIADTGLDEIVIHHPLSPFETIDNLEGPMAFHGDDLYYASGYDHIHKIIDVTAANSLTEAVISLNFPVGQNQELNYAITDLAFHGDTLYVSEFNNMSGDKISRVDITANPPQREEIYQLNAVPKTPISIFGDHIYFADRANDGQNQLLRLDVTAQTPTAEVLLTLPSAVDDMAFHGNDLYLISSSGLDHRVDVTVETPVLEELPSNLDSVTRDIVFQGNRLYHATPNAIRVVQSVNSETFEVVDLTIEGLDNPHGLAIHNNLLYIADTGTGEIVIHDLSLSATIWEGDDLTFTKASNADWSLQANQDRITDDVWITRQHNRPIYNYKWWQETFSTDATGDDLQYEFQGDGGGHTPTQSFTATGGTKGLRWAILDDTGSTTDNWEGFSMYGTLGNPAHFYSFNNVVTMISLLEREEDEVTITINSVVDNFIVNNTSSTEGTTDRNGPANDFHKIVGKNLGVWIEEENIYFTLTFNSWVSGGGGGGFSYTRSTASTLSIDKPLPTQSRVILLPNPVRNQLQLFGLSHSQTYTIYNLLGVESGQGKIDDGGAVPVSDLPKGLYFLKLESGQALKFVKE